MPLVRVLSLIVIAAVLGAGVAYAVVGLIRPDEPEAVAPVLIDPAAGEQGTTATAPAPAVTRTATERGTASV